MARSLARVVDQQGSTVPNATVTITEPSKNLTISHKTSAGGDFQVPGLFGTRQN